MSDVNRRWIIREKPVGMVEERHLSLEPGRIPEPGEGQVVVKLLYLSLDPGQLFYMSADDETIGGGTSKVGDVVRGWAVGCVVASRSDRFPVGSYVRDRYGHAGMQEYSLLSEHMLAAIDPGLGPLSAQLSSLGMPALTAYFGMIDIGRPKAGETVVVSGASGGVGSAAGQIAQLKGCRAVGIAGGPEKCRYVVEALGFDACVDHRAPDFEAQLAAACPDGIDIYFDNVAGRVLDSCLPLLAMRGRIVGCGAVAEYANITSWDSAGAGASQGLRNYLFIQLRCAYWEGLSIHNYYDRYDEAYAALERWYREGKLRNREEVHVGLETFVPAFHRLFSGKNFGKVVIQVNEEEGV